MNYGPPGEQLLKNVIVCILCVGWAATAALAQSGQLVSPPGYRGSIVGVAVDHRSLTLVDQYGTTTSVPLTSDTRYTMRRSDANFDDVVKFGMDVSVEIGTDGKAAEVRARGMNMRPNPAQLQAFMRASDSDWAVLQPKIQRVQELLATLQSEQPMNNSRGRNWRGRGPSPAPDQSAESSSLRQLRQTLEANFFNDSASPGQIASSIAALRQARAQAKAQLETARKELVQLLTPRQEALLMMLGILD